MVDQARARKLAGRIRHIVADVLERQVKDPRLASQLRLVTVTAVRMTPDLREATVFYTVLGEQEDRREAAAALESAKGLIRAAVGRGTGVKFTPVVTFVLDAIPEYVAEFEEALAAARLADARVDEVRRGAVPAGDPDPYREPAVRTRETDPF